MKNINGFITKVESLKAEMGKSDSTLSPKTKQIILENKLGELKGKDEQLQGEIEREIEDFFAYLNMKQANIETLNNLKSYIEAEIKKVEHIIYELKVSD